MTRRRRPDLLVEAGHRLPRIRADRYGVAGASGERTAERAMLLALQQLAALAMLGASVAGVDERWAWRVRLAVARELGEALNADYQNQTADQIFQVWNRLNRPARREERP